MSGITASTYVIEAARERERERERQEHRAAWADYAAQRAELTALRAEAQGYRNVLGTQIAKIPTGRRLSRGASAAQIRTATDETRQLVAEHRRRLRDSVATAARDNVLRSVRSTHAAEAAAAAATAVQPVHQQAPAARRSAEDIERERKAREKTQAVREKRVTRAAELLARLPAHADAATRSACTRAVEEITAATSEARAQLLLTDLAAKVRQAERAEQQTLRTSIALAALAARLDSVDAEEAAELRAVIDRLTRERARAVPEGLADRVDAAVESAERARRRRMVAAAMRLSLDDLGYSVTEGFETVLVDRGAAYASLPDRPGYGVKVLLDTSQDVIRTQVVRSDRAHADSVRDTDAEKSFCDTYPTLLRRLRAHGVGSEELGVVPPGQRRVATVAESQLPAAAGAVHRSGSQTREMGR